MQMPTRSLSIWSSNVTSNENYPRFIKVFFKKTYVDECAAQTDKCQQICINQDGAYTCGCHQGFSLQSDGRTCSLCLACSPEFKQMQADYKQLHRRVLRLEREKSQIRKNVTKLKRSLRRCMRNKCKRQSATTTNEPTSTTTETTTRATTTKATQPTTTKATQPTTITTPKTVPTTTKPDNIKTTTVPITDKSLKRIEYMISSMNKQFAIIEERLEECKYTLVEPVDYLEYRAIAQSC
ncbi:unnamed protein product [Acanthosepion pharaonis]|uniref:EGF-like domain-containing protein n=1 Tax=Acanthosepion pharaonis TaxID=158019 RepID=A0A812D6V2_ACAPH|nr:unnamed protein product [Sepia pharaonis]